MVSLYSKWQPRVYVLSQDIDDTDRTSYRTSRRHWSCEKRNTFCFTEKTIDWLSLRCRDSIDKRLETPTEPNVAALLFLSFDLLFDASSPAVTLIPADVIFSLRVLFFQTSMGIQTQIKQVSSGFHRLSFSMCRRAVDCNLRFCSVVAKRLSVKCWWEYFQRTKNGFKLRSEHECFLLFSLKTPSCQSLHMYFLRAVYFDVTQF